MSNKRPVNLQLSTMKFPPTAIASILHRVSGVLLFLLIPLLLCLFANSLSSAASFHHMQQVFSYPLPKLILWGVFAALAYHFVAGVRHLLMDLGYGESKQCGRMSALAVIALAIVLVLIIGMFIW